MIRGSGCIRHRGLEDEEARRRSAAGSDIQLCLTETGSAASASAVAIRTITDPMVKELPPEFDRLYATNARPSIVPEKLLQALLLQVQNTIRSESMTTCSFVG